MPAITPDELKSLDFGYLTGADLMDYIASELLISRYQIDSTKFIRGCKTAYSYVLNKVSTRYDCTEEITKTGDAREYTLVKIMALHAIGNVMGNIQGFSQLTKDELAWAKTAIIEIRTEQLSLQLPNATSLLISPAYIVSQSFGTLG